MDYCILYNPLAGNGSGYVTAKRARRSLKGNKIELIDFTKIIDYSDFFKSLPLQTRIVVSGGDGTLNRFINYSNGANIPHDVFYTPGGSGNDFMKDLSLPDSEEPVLINRYLEHLPYVLIKGKKYFFLNGVGMGLDGFCCEEGEKTRGRSKKPINYTKIAFEALLYKYRPRSATVTVDGREYQFKNVWLTPTMNGRYFGGGMMPTPNQDRLNPAHKVSVMVAHDAGKFKVLSIFPHIFNGTHTDFADNIEILEGNDIHVRYSEPAPVQLDGEVIPGVTEYHVFSE